MATVKVKGYTRKDGVKVKGFTRHTTGSGKKRKSTKRKSSVRHERHGKTSDYYAKSDPGFRVIGKPRKSRKRRRVA